MTSRERVLTAFNHVNPDRVPLDFEAEPEVNRTLIDRLETGSMEGLLTRLNVDFRMLDKHHFNLPVYKGPPPVERSDGVVEDMWGCRRKMVEY